MGHARLLKTGYRLLHADRAQEALAQAEDLMTRRPEDARPRFLKALALHALDRTDEALALLADPAGSSAGDHVRPLLAAILRYDRGDLEGACTDIGTARLLSHDENFVVVGMGRLIRAAAGDPSAPLAGFASCPSVYNGFVAPRLLLELESRILADPPGLDLTRTRWARFEDERPAAAPRSWRTDLPFYALRLPVLALRRLTRRPVMPLRAEEAYLRGDLAAARETLRARKPKRGERRAQFQEWEAMLAFDLEDFGACRTLLPPPAEDPDPTIEFMRGVACIHGKRWREAAAALGRAATVPMAHYFHGLALLAVGDRALARRAFEREWRRNDLDLAERILLAGRLLSLFGPDADPARFHGDQ